jgi:hypothetical protein
MILIQTCFYIKVFIGVRRGRKIYPAPNKYVIISAIQTSYPVTQ